jgi:hypothetical protein
MALYSDQEIDDHQNTEDEKDDTVRPVHNNEFVGKIYSFRPQLLKSPTGPEKAYQVNDRQHGNENSNYDSGKRISRGVLK